MLVLVLVTFLLGAVAGVGGSAALDGASEPAVPVVTEPVGAVHGPVGTAVARPEAAPITLAFVGDVNAAGVLGDRLATDPDGFVGPFAPLLRDADLVVANLETAVVDPVAPAGEPLDKEYTFRAPATILGALAAGGVDVASAANNHAIDYGPAGLAQTLAAKDASAGMLIGIGADEDAAYQPFVRDVGGVRVAVIAATQVLDAELISSWTAGPDQAGVASAKRVDRLVESVTAAGADADVVVVFLHWGTEGEECPTQSQQELAQALVDAGADVVVGSHAHRVLGGGHLDGAVVHYGLGNFLFGSGSPRSARTGVFLVRVDPDGPVSSEWVPGRIEGSVPQPLTGDEAAVDVAEWQAERACTNLAP